MSGPASPRRSRIAHFKAPFILSIAAPAALGLGCGGKTDDGLLITNPPPQVGIYACEGDPPISEESACPTSWRCVNGEWQGRGDPTCNPPRVPDWSCPEAPAEIGTSCAGYPGGLSCEYDYCYGKTPMRRCNESTALWEDIPIPTCNPPPPEPEGCEPTLPVPGSDCGVAERVCLYAPGCNGPDSAICRSGQWVVTYTIGAACNPPAVVVPVCPERDIVTGAGCPYEGQQCGSEACENGGASHGGHVCTSGQWQAAVVSCPVPTSVPDGGVPDGGVPDGGS